MNFSTIKISQKATKHQFISAAGIRSFSEWIAAMLESDSIILKFNQVLKESRFDAYFWEVKPVSLNKLDQPFEFVLVNSESLKSVTADNSPFDKYFQKDRMVVNFPNLRADAKLIVPTPISTDTEYEHLAKFVRSASDQQIIKFWRAVVKTYKNEIGTETKWLSTSGLGVYWLHARIDSRPKYYQHQEYKYDRNKS